MTPSTHITISKEQLSALPKLEYEGEITVVDTPAKAQQALAEIECCRVVGFDTETKPSFRKGIANNVSLIQVSTGARCYLFRLNKIGFTEPMRHFMENPDVVKIGLSLKDDFHVMHRNSEFEPRGFIDLQSVVGRYGIADASLSKIYAILFGRRISKSQRLSNWEADKLTPGQQVYASIDAWACLRIWDALEAGRFHPDESPYMVDAQSCATAAREEAGA